MADQAPVFKSAFSSWQDEFSGQGIRPVVFDVCSSADWTTSILPDDLKMVLHVNPNSLKFTNKKQTERIQTRGGWVEQHWGDAPSEMTIEGATGGFMRLGSGLSNITRPGPGTGGQDLGGGRRDTIAYDKFLDILALFHSNGSVYDRVGNIAFQGIIKMSFDGGIWYGWFTNFSVTETAEKPYQFNFNMTFQVHREIHALRTQQILQPTTKTRFDAGGANSGSWDPKAGLVPDAKNSTDLLRENEKTLTGEQAKEVKQQDAEEKLVKKNEKRVKPKVPKKPARRRRRRRKKKKTAAVTPPSSEGPRSIADSEGNEVLESNPYHTDPQNTPLFGGSVMTMGCFVGATKVRIEGGVEVSLENLKVGDLVESLNPKTLVRSFSSVSDLIIRERSEIVSLRFTHSTSQCTFEHPIWVKGKGWSSYQPEMSQSKYGIKVSKLEVGDAVVYKSPEGKFLEARLLEITQSWGSQFVYMPVLDGHQSFFANGVLVHIPGGR